MPAPKLVPELKRHKARGYYYVNVGGGKKSFGSDYESAYAAWRQWSADRLAGKPDTPRLTLLDTSPPQLAAALLLYRRHAGLTYGTQRATLERIDVAIEAAVSLFPAAAADKFRGPQLKQVREWLLTQRRSKTDGEPLSRTYVNYLVSALQRAFRWLASEDVIPGDTLTSLLAVERLRKGRGGREPDRVLPPPDGWNSCLPFAPPTVADMARVQALAGMRPQDVCRMKRGELSTGPGEKVEMPGTGRSVSAMLVDGVVIWLYVPSAHKTDWKGKPRVVALGPMAQAILRPRLDGLAPDASVFDPRTSLRETKRGVRHKKVKGSYATRQYAQAVDRAIARANRKGVPCPHWSPNQLRHLSATLIGETFDAHHAAAVLGHSGTDTITTYCEQSVGKAARVAAAMG